MNWGSSKRLRLPAVTRAIGFDSRPRTCILRAAIVGLALTFATTNLHAERPAWCQPGYVCLKSEVAEQREQRIIDLEHEVAKVRAKRPRWFGWTVGPGLAYTGGDAELPFQPALVVAYGFRF